MFTPKAHIIIIDGPTDSGRNTLCFELALTLLYNAQRTAIVLAEDSPLRQAIKKRRMLLPQLLTPAIIDREAFYDEANKYSAVIIPHIKADDELSVTASTYISIIKKEKTAIRDFQKNIHYINGLFELKKKIAATYGHGLNWVVCENNMKTPIAELPSPELEKFARTHGFRAAPPLNFRQSYKNNITGISAQDKSLPILKKELTYEDICSKREIVKLAEFIFN